MGFPTYRVPRIVSQQPGKSSPVLVMISEPLFWRSVSSPHCLIESSLVNGRNQLDGRMQKPTDAQPLMKTSRCPSTRPGLRAIFADPVPGLGSRWLMVPALVSRLLLDKQSSGWAWTRVARVVEGRSWTCFQSRLCW